MSKLLIGGLTIVGAIVIGALFFIGSIVSTLNNEASLRVGITTKQKDNNSEFDNMFKVISQTAQVSQEQKEGLRQIFNEYAEKRAGNQSATNGSLANWIHEAVPNPNLETYKNLQNIITSHRDAWTMRQKELLDLNREHETLLVTFPSNMICSIFGRKSIDVTIVTSTRTDKAFQTGKDDDTSVFPQK